MYKDSNRPANRMTSIVNKIERRLGTIQLNLPDSIGKDYWPVIIEEDSITTFSRYFPYCITVIIDRTCKKDDFYFIDKDVPEGSEILGVQDVNWDMYRANSGYDRYSFLQSYGADEIALTQVSADYLSLFNLGIYPIFEPPNKIRLETTNGNIYNKGFNFPLKIFLKHPANLMTISPTKMELFEELCCCDVAIFLYHQLKYYNDVDTAYLTTSLLLDSLQEYSNKRETLIDKFENSYVSQANENQPSLLCI